MTPTQHYQVKYPCPDCGAKDALTEADIRRGYHCYKCTKIAEGSMAYE